jgi:uncharacterized protein DUF1844
VNPSETTPEERAPGTPEERISALFANMVVQQTNMALMFLGRVPHPESGKPVRDLQAAQMFIDQLEMLEAKTKGNLDKHEAGFLKQNLTALRMAFVEAADHERSATPEKTGPETAATPAAGETAPQTESSASDAESRKKFSKKY